MSDPTTDPPTSKTPSEQDVHFIFSMLKFLVQKPAIDMNAFLPISACNTEDEVYQHIKQISNEYTLYQTVVNQDAEKTSAPVSGTSTPWSLNDISFTTPLTATSTPFKRKRGPNKKKDGTAPASDSAVNGKDRGEREPNNDASTVPTPPPSKRRRGPNKPKAAATESSVQDQTVPVKGRRGPNKPKTPLTPATISEPNDPEADTTSSNLNQQTNGCNPVPTATTGSGYPISTVPVVPDYVSNVQSPNTPKRRRGPNKSKLETEPSFNYASATDYDPRVNPYYHQTKPTMNTAGTDAAPFDWGHTPRAQKPRLPSRYKHKPVPDTDPDDDLPGIPGGIYERFPQTHKNSMRDWHRRQAEELYPHPDSETPLERRTRQELNDVTIYGTGDEFLSINMILGRPGANLNVQQRKQLTTDMMVASSNYPPKMLATEWGEKDMEPEERSKKIQEHMRGMIIKRRAKREEEARKEELEKAMREDEDWKWMDKEEDED